MESGTMNSIIKEFNKIGQILLGSRIFDIKLLNKLRKLFYGSLLHGSLKRCGHKVNVSSEHSLGGGKIICGKHVIINNNVLLDTTGDLKIDDYVLISENVAVYTHTHDYINASREKGYKKPVVKTSIHICEGAWIGAGAIILPSVRYIGKGSIIGAGSVVAKDVDDNTIVAGNPAKFLKNKFHNEI